MNALMFGEWIRKNDKKQDIVVRLRYNRRDIMAQVKYSVVSGYRLYTELRYKTISHA